ncbi:hypothetical protein [Streptomyces sp. NPDC060027]|uniref:hypothetical protein n=1 Tax=Streptomyces sp. NPDC060027 TaxID=3347040 RepID=UPI0036A8E019
MTLTAAAGSTVAPVLSGAIGEHSWRDWSFSAGWGTGNTLDTTLTKPEWWWRSA